MCSPDLLWATGNCLPGRRRHTVGVPGIFPGHVGGVTMVLDRSGVIMPIRSRLEQAVQMRDKLMDELGDYLSNKFLPSRVVAD